MEKVQHITRAAIRRASTMEVPQQAKQNMQELFVNFCLILICLLLIYIIVLLMIRGDIQWGCDGFFGLVCHSRTVGKMIFPTYAENLHIYALSTACERSVA
ncbi:cardiac phospholamban isoform X1 [Xyrauchen texanus]|nr:cardiac phospholamban isoform X1 [Xyrauchen texanus]